MKVIHGKPIACVMLIGKDLKVFPLTSGSKQWCLLFPLKIFIIVIISCFFFKIRFLFIVLAILELTLKTTLASNSQRSICSVSLVWGLKVCAINPVYNSFYFKLWVYVCECLSFGCGYL